MNWLKKYKQQVNSNEEGFTLIELMIVVVIIGILAAIAIPIFANQQKATIDSQTTSDMKTANTAIATWLTKDPTASSFNAAQIKAIQEYSNDTKMVLIGTPLDYCLKGFNEFGAEYTSAEGPYLIFVSKTGKIGSQAEVGYASSLSCGENNARHYSIHAV